ncbi:general odorant-binding protein 99a-like [Bactrocera neohumeralis]|uniref:Odorant-binding protein n=2 Tax=Bactrocera TaxID=47832 RepID=S5R4H9_BACDO|nr:general odorant-binding protein 99a [Bactrocera dorsalis]XP_039964533.1 general odorant-binding protein 99a-like [Bactrocera tryoni]XP_050326248.1 general odorant-binding protein 99a-like [Bactrocera neohumeralis]AGC82131.1 odorant-binding protein 2 [Bactrocera dorsalis]AGS08192.1 odorant binding protein 10 [Bactrocera dorsalis]AKI29023.1 odorant binding protein 99c-1 [Bactrocera dorsalis]QKN21338.1 odorant-binding protein [Bactrocera dorsalis]QKN21453.1 odorant-binding protein [Bactrocer
MKFFIVILAVVALAYADEEWVPKNVAQIKAIRQECIKDFPLSEEYIQKMKNFEYPDEEPVRKYLLCTAKKLGVFCEHEGYHADRVAKQFKMDLDEAEVIAIAEGCADKNVEGSSADVWAYRGHKCVMASKIGERVKAYIQKSVEEAKKH